MTAILKTAPGKTDGRERFVRISSFAVAGVLAALIATTVMPPLVADQSDRAVVNAPVTLLTAQISGEVKSLTVAPGQLLRSGEPIARIVNERVDRATLIGLESKASEAHESVEATRMKRETSLQYVNTLDAEITRQTTELDAHFLEEIAEIKARIGAADAAKGEKDDVLGRQTSLASRNVTSTEMVKAAQRQLSAASYEKDATVSVLAQKQAQLEALRRGVFVGPELTGLSTLTQKRRDLAFEVQQLAIQEREIAAGAESSKHLLSAERYRLEEMTESNVTAPLAGRTMTVGVSQGRHVLPGDTLASIVDCERSFVVAIFSYRRAQDLAVGSRMRIESQNWAEPHFGRVSEILPRVTDKVDEGFAVPFPQTERRELYVLVEPERPQDDEAKGELCNIGRWVTVTRDNGWMPSASVMWNEAGRALSYVAGQAIRPAKADVLPANKIHQAFSAVGTTAQ
jgi:multidrug resistance efflux pump